MKKKLRAKKKLTREQSDRLVRELWAQTDLPEGTYKRVMAEWEALEKESLEWPLARRRSSFVPSDREAAEGVPDRARTGQSLSTD